MKEIILMSDSTGDLGERMIRALISQFPKGTFTVRILSFLNNPDAVTNFFQRCVPETTILFHTIMSADMKSQISDLSMKRKVPAYDLTGGAMNFLEKASGLKHHPSPEMLHELNSEYDRRIEALGFTVEHDDGLGMGSLNLADIVLLGPSRVSKTPTSIFLANKGFKVGNIPLIKGFNAEDFIGLRPRPKFAGLLIKPYKLREIRLRRATEEKIPGEDYTDLRSIEEELKQAHLLYLELNCPIVDVTDHAVEETAALVLKALRLR